MLKRPWGQEWEIDPLAEIAFRLWVEYYDATEMFDEIVCSGRMKDGTPIGANSLERSRSDQYARRLYKMMLDAARDEGLDQRILENYRWEGLRIHEHKLGRKFP